MSTERGSGLAPLLETNLRTEPCDELHATDASPSGAGSCVASITREDWLALCELAEEKGERVRLDWKGEEPPSNMHDVRAPDAGGAHQSLRTGEPAQPPQAAHYTEKADLADHEGNAPSDGGVLTVAMLKTTSMSSWTMSKQWPWPTRQKAQQEPRS